MSLFEPEDTPESKKYSHILNNTEKPFPIEFLYQNYLKIVFIWREMIPDWNLDFQKELRIVRDSN